MKATLYSAAGKEAGEIDLPETLFGAKRNDALVRQVVLAMQANARTAIAHTKGRGEVRGGGKKPWKQKGTGRARHGSIRSPIWRGGGTTFGPSKDKDYSQKINKKMRAKALAIVLSEKLKSGRILFVDSLALTAPKTKEAKAMLGALSAVKGFDMLSARRNNAALMLFSKKDEVTMKSFRNMGNVMAEEARNANPVDVLAYRYLVVVDPETSLKSIASRLEK
ncbi:MAG: 50S ribosomal protein L4 [Patescibacteria group bacterium]|nr:50S ribosomal protein L4 [Patescibacteria group bacterium]